MHAFGGQIDSRRIGSFGDMTCFSFDPVKIITSIDGGCVIINDKEEFEALQKMRILGVDRDTTERYKNRRAWEYDVVSEGYRYHLTNIMAAVGISQIKRVDEFIETRRVVCQRYNESFQDLPDVVVPQTDFRGVSPFIYSLRVLNGRRERLIQHLQQAEIDTGIHFVPVHEHSHFESARCGDLSVTRKVVDEVLTLPLHSNMAPASVERVVDAITDFFE
jgi:dTDP-4-amino-4,6-dideoxygalactose transaminase